MYYDYDIQSYTFEYGVNRLRYTVGKSCAVINIEH
ncbi:MAG: hypothetical protein K0Q73_7088 [Paenibacillus sp.]|nr:hypothetical protein [Paenibacillus sp.]